MGCRGNIISIENGNPIYFYTHWNGDIIHTTLRDAFQNILKSRRALDDSSYTNRVIFCTMVGEKYLKETTSFGISSRLGDNEYPFIIVNYDTEKVYIKKESSDLSETDTLYPVLSLMEYANLTDEDLKLYEEFYNK